MYTPPQEAVTFMKAVDRASKDARLLSQNGKLTKVNLAERETYRSFQLSHSQRESASLCCHVTKASEDQRSAFCGGAEEVGECSRREESSNESSPVHVPMSPIFPSRSANTGAQREKG